MGANSATLLLCIVSVCVAAMLAAPAAAQEVWRVSVNSSATGPVRFNATHMLASGYNTYLIEYATGRSTMVAASGFTDSVPLVDGDVIFVCGNLGQHLMAVNVRIGKKLWSNDSVSCDFGMKLVSNVLITWNTAFRASDGMFLWAAAQYDNTVSAVTEVGGGLAFMYNIPMGNLFVVEARDATTGAIRYNISSNFNLATSDTQPRPLIIDGVLVLPNMAGHDVATGSLLWSVPGGTSLAVQEVVTGPNTVAFALSNQVILVTASTGAMLSVDIKLSSFQVGLVTADFIYICGDVEDALLNATTGAVLWTTSFLLELESSYNPVFYNAGVLYVSTAEQMDVDHRRPRRTFALNATNGKMLASWDSGSVIDLMLFDSLSLYVASIDSIVARKLA